MNAIGFQTDRGNEKLEVNRESLTDFFRLELLNRIDDILVFQPFSSPDWVRIIEKMLAESRVNIMKQYHIDVSFDQTVLEWVAKQVNAIDGAREIKRFIEEKIESEILQHIINKDWESGLHYRGMITEQGLNLSAW